MQTFFGETARDSASFVPHPFGVQEATEESSHEYKSDSCPNKNMLEQASVKARRREEAPYELSQTFVMVGGTPRRFRLRNGCGRL